MPSCISSWVSACRPKTLVASIIPIIVGSAKYFAVDHLTSITIWVLMGCLIFSALIQVATNLANDYFDSIKGADINRRNAPLRMVSSGQIEGRTVLKVAILLLTFAFLVGVATLALSKASFWFFPLGVLCIALAILYTGGPYPLAYNGLGDLFVVLFFGFFAVEGTNYLLSCANGLNFAPNLSKSLSIGFLINNLLVVNNYRDFESDILVGKNTTIVLFGKKFGIAMFVAGFSIPIFHGILSNQFYLLWIIVPSLFSLKFLLSGGTKEKFDKALSLSALSILIFGVSEILYYLK